MDGQNAIKSNFFGDNHGTIELTGKNTVGISSQIVYNRETGSIKVGESSIAQHAVYKDVVDYERFIINEGKIILGKDSTGIRMDKEYNNIDGFANNYGKIESNAENVTGIMAYIKDAKHPINNTNPISYIDNDGEINLSGDKSKGMYADGKGKMKMRNRNKIIIGNSFDKNNPSIAMHSINPENETINDGVIEVGKRSRGMSDANGGTLTNNGKIIVKGENGIGMYLANGSKGVNNGTIKTEPTAKNAIGVFIGKDSEFTNNGNIIINSEGGTGVLVDGGIVKNTGIFIIESNYSTGISSKGGKIISSGGYFVIKGSGSTGIIANGSPEISGTDFIIGGSGSTGKNILKAFTKAIPAKAFPAKRNLGIYVDSLGKTNPIEGLANLGLNSADLLIGAEATEKTNATEVTVGQDVLDPFNKSIKESNIPYWTVGSGSLIWEANPEIKDNRVEKVTLRKQSYTKFADEKTKDVAEGLDEKYVVASEKDKQVFNYMNTLRDAESLGKAYKEIAGSQYINVQQRINQTDSLLDSQVSSLQKESIGKAGHHVATFFDRNKHDFRTDEVPDTTSAAFGASYLFNADSSWGVYGGVAINNYKFKDKGHSKESVSMLKAGGYKKFDLSIGDLDWTLGGDVFVSQNSMKRRIMTDKVYENKADYNAYGFSVKNEISKTYELGENGTIKPYGALKIGYGSFGKIKEKDATMGLDVKGNSYYSVKPSAGVELAYTKGITGNTRFKAALDLAYEHELGNAGRKENQMKYINTNKTYRLKGEKAESRGNVRSGVKVGLETGNFNFSVNSGYDTKDKNAHVGLGIGASF
ncbi:autotransporter outer membrane beta-barrel domain-containing protein [Leptotrichia alba]|uniref:Autotransporter outer membrane beta-barrel domain-containing protein n=1 Tax=Leptotrichia alba TaxID=3239304 RepID=A0AB39V6P8_9FUSO